MAGASNKTSSNLSPFEFIKSINDTKVNIISQDPENAKYYNAFVVNRSLSYFPDTIYFANEMNKYHQLDDDMQYNFLLNIVRKRKRFSKWDKSAGINNINIIKSYYGYSEEKARQVADLLTDDQITSILHKVSIGGRK